MATTNLNYIPSAIDCLEKISAYYKSAGVFNSYAGAQWVISLLKRAHKFMLPNGGQLIGLDLTRINNDIPLEFVNLPYPITAIEYYMDSTENIRPVGAEEIECHKRIGLGIEVAKLLDDPLMPSYIKKHIGAEDYKDDIAILSLFSTKETEYCQLLGVKDFWVMNSAFIVIRKSTVTEELLTVSKETLSNIHECDPATLRKLNIAVSMVPITPEIISSQFEDGRSYDDILAYVSADTNDELAAILDMCVALQCNNIGTDIVEPPHALNKKRVKNGKLPFYEYKVLTVKVANTKSGGGYGVSERLSPRQHFRRGHIRHLPNKQLTWVSACVVGNAELGKINKTYKVV